MNRKVLGTVAAMALASVGTFALVAFVRGAEDRALAGERLASVLVVNERVEAGTPASELEGRLATERVPAKVLADGAVDDLADVEGRVAAVDLLPGEQLTSARFVEVDDFSRNRAQVDVPEDLLEVTLALDPERAVGGVLRPGTRVAVAASFDPFEISSENPVELEGMLIPGDGKTPNSTHIVLHKKLVTNVQTAAAFETQSDDESGAAPAPTGKLLVTLALTAAEVEKVVFAAEHGSVWLAVDPEKASTGGTRVQTRGSIYR